MTVKLVIMIQMVALAAQVLYNWPERYTTYLSMHFNKHLDSYCGIDCPCNINGSLKNDDSACTPTDPCPCDSNGVCTCSIGYTGDNCVECETGYFDLDGNNFDSSSTCAGK